MVQCFDKKTRNTYELSDEQYAKVEKISNDGKNPFFCPRCGLVTDNIFVLSDHQCVPTKEFVEKQHSIIKQVEDEKQRKLDEAKKIEDEQKKIVELEQAKKVEEEKLRKEADAKSKEATTQVATDTTNVTTKLDVSATVTTPQTDATITTGSK